MNTLRYSTVSPCRELTPQLGTAQGPRFWRSGSAPIEPVPPLATDVLDVEAASRAIGLCRGVSCRGLYVKGNGRASAASPATMLGSWARSSAGC